MMFMYTVIKINSSFTTFIQNPKKNFSFQKINSKMLFRFLFHIKYPTLLLSFILLVHNGHYGVESAAVFAPDPKVKEGYTAFGDMLLPSDFLVNTRTAVPTQELLWPNAEIPYVIGRSLKRHTNLIEESMEEYHTKTCIRFVPRTTEKNYIVLTYGSGCFSYIGMVGGKQFVSLGSGCVIKGTIIHELGHAIGFFHEQNRQDRDEYVKILWRNINIGMSNQFFRLEPYQHLLMDKFDYNSIMLYGERAFSRDGRLKTMVSKNGQRLREVFDKTRLSKSDVKRINTIYKCEKPSEEDNEELEPQVPEETTTLKTTKSTTSTTLKPEVESTTVMAACMA